MKQLKVSDIRKAVKKMRKLSVKPDGDGNITFHVQDYRMSEIGRQNWEVCARMLVHDLLDLSEKNPELKKVLDYYRIRYLPDGGYTMALPRMLLK